VELAPDNPPSSTSIFLAEWNFNSDRIIQVLQSGETITVPAYKDRASLNVNTLALTLDKLTLGDSGKYELRVSTISGGILTGETSLQVFGECFAKTWFSIYCKIISCKSFTLN